MAKTRRLRKYPKYTSDRHYRRTYGITESDYLSLKASQGNACGMCGVSTPGILLVVDHNHKNGKVRGLLCDKCNRGLGFLGDNLPVILRRLTRYYANSKTLARQALNDPKTQQAIKAQANRLYQS